MQIDRSRFLMLTASLAAGGCSGSQPQALEVPEQTVVVIAPPPVEPMEPVGKDAVVAAEPVEPPMPPLIGPVEEDPLDAEELALVAAAGSCGNDRGRVSSCRTLRPPGPMCESFDDTLDLCDGFATGMQPRAAEKAVACLLARSGQRSICQFDVGQKCAVEALKSVCLEPYSDQPCRTVMVSCRGTKLTQQQCQRALSAVKGRNRLQLLTCISEGCSVDYCFYNLS
jgi:hypothetical protein